MLLAIEEHQPELICLSVTMPHHLDECRNLISHIRAKFPHIKLAVGGQAFTRIKDLWKKMDVDFSSDDASALIQWAQTT